MQRERITWLATLLKDILAPKYCFGCHKRNTFLCSDCAFQTAHTPDCCLYCAHPTGIGICRSCTKKTGLTKIYWHGRYQNPTLRTLIHAYKYRGARDIAKDIAPLFTTFIRDLPQDATLVSIPLHPKRLKFRGFNQSAELARNIATCTKRKITGPLIRQTNTPPLARRDSKKQRQRIIHNAFTIASPPPKRVILVDDVATSGSTLREAARTLKNAGAEEIFAVIFLHD